jgi:hypothetical protein
MEFLRHRRWMTFAFPHVATERSRGFFEHDQKSERSLLKIDSFCSDFFLRIRHPRKIWVRKKISLRCSIIKREAESKISIEEGRSGVTAIEVKLF